MRPKLIDAALYTAVALTLVVIALAASALNASVAAAAGTDHMMGSLASHQTMGWKDNTVPMDKLERRIARGERIYVSCSIITELGYRLAQRNGIPARRVSAITNGRFDGYNDGHTMLELKLGGHWVLYDLDLNRVAVDGAGHRVGLGHQVKAGSHRHWRVIAHDRDSWDFRGTTRALREHSARYARMSAERWYQRVLGVALVETSPGQYAYNAPSHSPRIEAVWPGHYHWVSARTWRSLM